VIDHVIPLAKGGADTDENCRALCLPHHHERTREQFGQRKRVEIALDGWPKD